MEKSLNPEDNLPNIPIHFHTNFNVRRKFEVYQCPTNIDVPCHTKYQFPLKSLPFTNKNRTNSSSNDPNSCNRFKLGWFSRKPRFYHFSVSEKERNNVAQGSRRSPKLYKDLHIRNVGKISSAKLENVCVSPRTLLRQHRSLRGDSFPAVQDPHNTASLALGSIFRENTLLSFLATRNRRNGEFAWWKCFAATGSDANERTRPETGRWKTGRPEENRAANFASPGTLRSNDTHTPDALPGPHRSTAFRDARADWPHGQPPIELHSSVPASGRGLIPSARCWTANDGSRETPAFLRSSFIGGAFVSRYADALLTLFSSLSTLNDSNLLLAMHTVHTGSRDMYVQGRWMCE